jgi:hypothetical protein
MYGVEPFLMNRVGLALVFLLLAIAGARATDRHTVYVQVIWGTDKERPAGTTYPAIGPKLSAKLSPVFRWKHYWETERKKVQLDPSKVTKVALTNHRALEIERFKSGETEVRLFRRTGLVTKNRQPSPERMFILGGEDSTRDSFFVVVRPDEPKNGE